MNENAQPTGDDADALGARLDAFAAEAERFAEWLRSRRDEGAVAEREALRRLTALYLAGLDLPPYGSVDLDEVEDDEEREKSYEVGREEWRVAFEAAGRLRVGYYWTVFDPLDLDDHEAVAGLMADDLADVYRDVVEGLNAYRAGDRVNAAWAWSFGLQGHWGAHATSAMRALHWSLSRDPS